ncbi:uncharacterized protein V1516DRAFT_630086 [Lipomyces oligophaga]|uniref:uncharacterized protein n=1 Tax=Lipomyces oligophaga TaxID=45792 RepID=UPI0034CE6957
MYCFLNFLGLLSLLSLAATVSALPVWRNIFERAASSSSLLLSSLTSSVAPSSYLSHVYLAASASSTSISSASSSSSTQSSVSATYASAYLSIYSVTASYSTPSGIWIVGNSHDTSTQDITSSTASSSYDSSSTASSVSSTPSVVVESGSSLQLASSNATTSFTNAFQLSVYSDSLDWNYAATVNPLTAEASTSGGTDNVTFRGYLVDYAANSTANLTSESIAYISCDDSDLASQAVIRAMTYYPSFILLYSTTSRACVFTQSYKFYNGDLGAVFSTLSASLSRQILYTIRSGATNLEAAVTVNETEIYEVLSSATSTPSSTSSAALGRTTVVTTQTIISPDSTETHTSESVIVTTETASAQATASSTSDSSSNSSGSSNALIALYAITGVISCLFLVIIILGALRLHRHPERYQFTRNADGTVQRNTRARGIAKAVLDTLPLVHLPTPQEQAKKNGIEEKDKAEGAESSATGALEISEKNGDTGNSMESTSRFDSAGEATIVHEDQDMDKIHELPDKIDDIADKSDNNGVSTPIPIADEFLPDSMIHIDTCPICFEPFLAGQDLRVLPCRHGFHAACVDPWLLNSSSQCPLCRVDLNLRLGVEIPDSPPELLDSTEIDPNTHPVTAAAAGAAAARAAALAAVLAAQEEARDNQGWVRSSLSTVLDRVNIQMLPSSERARAREQIRREEEQRRERRRLRQQNIANSQSTTRWRKFVQARRALFHQQQQAEQQQNDQQQEPQPQDESESTDTDTSTTRI